jgi:hypothetical protein
MPMSMSTVLSSDSSEHSTPPVRTSNLLNDAPLMRSLSVLDDIDNNGRLSARQPPSPTVSRGLISYSMSCFLRDVSCKKSQRGQPSVQAATASTSSSEYTRRPSLPFQWQRQGQNQEKQQSRGPPSPESLAHHGIKVRDFAYESNLPMIPSIPRVRQLVTARPLKRTKRYFEQPSDVFTVDTPPQSQSVAARSLQASSPSLLLDQRESADQSQSNPLERKSTEPVIFPERESARPYRDVGYADLSQIPSGSQDAQTNLRDTLTPATPTAVDRISAFSPVSLPFPFPPTRRLTTSGGSQESESSTDTPLDTPNGSLTWPTITSDLTASQLDHNNSSQAPALVHGTTAAYSQLGFPSPISQAPDSYSGAGVADAYALGSPRPTEVDSSPPRPPLDEDAADDEHNARTSLSPSPSPSPTRLSHAARPLTGLVLPPKGSTASGPRYFLRKHGSPRQDYASPSSPHRRRRSSIKAPAPYPVRVQPATRQAAHAAASGSSGRSPRAKPLRKTTL